MTQKFGGITEGGMQGRLEKFKEAIWRRRPILGEIMQKHGGQNLYDSLSSLP